MSIREAFMAGFVAGMRKQSNTVDIHYFDGMSKDQIRDSLKSMEVGSEITGLYSKQWDSECHVEKKRVFSPNYFAPQWAGGSPNDWGGYEEYWAIDGYDEMFIVSTIYDVLHDGDDYYYVI